jgi:hypothetical protein
MIFCGNASGTMFAISHSDLELNARNCTERGQELRDGNDYKRNQWRQCTKARTDIDPGSSCYVRDKTDDGNLSSGPAQRLSHAVRVTNKSDIVGAKDKHAPACSGLTTEPNGL